MKKYLYIASIGFLLFSCSGGGSSTPTPAPTPEVKNTAPTVPTLVAPINSKLCVDNLVNFQWNVSTDAESNAITYQIQVARDNQFSQIVSTIDGSAISQNISLDKGLAYYWRVKATDSKSLSSDFSAVYSFYTAGAAVANYLPFSPALVQEAWMPAVRSKRSLSLFSSMWSFHGKRKRHRLLFRLFLRVAEKQKASNVG